MKHLLVPSFTLGLGWLAACAPSGQAPTYDVEADRAAIEAIRAAEQAAAESESTQGFLDMMDAGGMAVMQPDGPVVMGEADIRDWLDGFMEAFSISFQSYQTDDVVVSGDLAVERYSGVWTLTPKAGGDPVTETVKGLHVYRRQADGSWRMTHDVWNSSDPPPGI